jgi:transposase
MRNSPRKYTQDFKNQVVNMLLNGKRIIDVSRDLDIPIRTIDRWIEIERKKNKPIDSLKNVNTSQLMKELLDVKEERDILKKALAIFSRNQDKNFGL